MPDLHTTADQDGRVRWLQDQLRQIIAMAHAPETTTEAIAAYAQETLDASLRGANSTLE
jgi:hypothetical protein